jgi:hypothetical protein
MTLKFTFIARRNSATPTYPNAGALNAGKQAGKQASRQAGKQASRQAGKQASRQAGKQASRQAGTQASRQASKQAWFVSGLSGGCRSKVALGCLISSGELLSGIVGAWIKDRDMW